MRHRGWIGVLAASLCAVACAHSPSPAPDVRYVEYLVGPPDRLTVTILPDPAVSRTSSCGRTHDHGPADRRHPGRRPHHDQISKDIENRIARFKRGALVTVSLAGAESPVVSVFGEVRNPRRSRSRADAHTWTSSEFRDSVARDRAERLGDRIWRVSGNVVGCAPRRTR